MINSVHIKKIRLLAYITTIIPFIAFANDDVSRSTSSLIRISYIDNQGDEIFTAENDYLERDKHYMSLMIPKITAPITSKWWERLFGSSKAFATIDATAQFSNQNLQITKISPAKKGKGSDQKLDLGFTPVIFDRLKFSLYKLSLDLRINKTSDDKLDSIVNSIAELDDPQLFGVSLSKNVTDILTLGKVVDKLLFKEGRVISPLHSVRNIFTRTQDLQEGFYVVFGSKDAKDYEKYYNGGNGESGKKIIWDGSDLYFNNDANRQSINDVAYFIINVQKSDTFYEDPSAALNNRDKSWSNSFVKMRALARKLMRTDSSSGEFNSLKEEYNQQRDLFESEVYQDIDLYNDEQDSIIEAAETNLGVELEEFLGSQSSLLLNNSLEEKLTRIILDRESEFL